MATTEDAERDAVLDAVNSWARDVYGEADKAPLIGVLRDRVIAARRLSESEIRSEVWDEGHNAGWNARDDDAQAGWTPSGPHESDAVNPYLAAEPAPGELFPGTTDALNALTIRKETDRG